MKTVNSLSGGKTSSYMAVHYPADMEVFALVCNEDSNCREKDPCVKQYIDDKLSRYAPYYGEVIGIAENPEVPRVLMDLEQYLGREIIWTRDVETFDSLVNKRNYLPNQMARFCTTELKMRPIFRMLKYEYSLDKVKMRIGYRWGEENRIERATTEFKHVYKHDLHTGKNRWETVDWRKNKFPLSKDKIAHFAIKEYWENVGRISFPKDSNCPHCFWKNAQQLRKNYDDYPNQIDWAERLERKVKASFKKDITMKQIKQLGLQAEFNFGTGSGCQAGFCTD